MHTYINSNVRCRHVLAIFIIVLAVSVAKILLLTGAITATAVGAEDPRER